MKAAASGRRRPGKPEPSSPGPWWIASLVLAIAAAAAPDLRAGIVDKSMELELYSGIYSPHREEVDDDATFGVRLGYNFTRRFNVQLEAGRWVTTGRLQGPAGEEEVDLRSTFLDLSFVLHMRPASRWVSTLYTGPGWSFLSADTPRGVAPNLPGDSFAWHAGFGGKIELTRLLYLRLAGRFRWYEAVEGGDVDREATLGLGFRFAP